MKTNKHDAADAEGCCEAVQRPSMRFVPVKSETQQALLMLHRIRDRLIAERTGTINAIRGHMAEFGIVAARQGSGMKELLAIISDIEDERLPAMARELLVLQVEHLRADRDEDRRPGSAPAAAGTQQRGRQAADGDPGHWPRDCHGNGGDGRQRADLPQWPQFCRVARSHATPIHNRWQGTAARH